MDISSFECRKISYYEDDPEQALTQTLQSGTKLCPVLSCLIQPFQIPRGKRMQPWPWVLETLPLILAGPFRTWLSRGS